MMRPQSEAELADLIATADGAIHIRGGGTRDVGRPVTGEALSTSGLSGVTLYEPGALTLVVRAGTALSEVETVLAAENQHLAFEPMDYRPLLGTTGTPTIGGVVASNSSGPRRIQVGACRDHLLGVRFVDGQGRILKNGGRVMKNVTGYDLVKLMAGSWGSLGVLSEVSLKVLPRPEAVVTLVLHDLDVSGGVRALSAALGSPFEVTGAAHAEPGVLADQSLTLIRIEGMAESVNYRAERLADLGGWEMYQSPEADPWRDIRDLRPFAGQSGAVWRVSVKPGDAPVISASLRGAGLDFQALHDWGGGLMWLRCEEIGDCGAARIRAEIAQHGGHATLIRAGNASRRDVPVFQPEPAALAAISTGLRRRFDPRAILNPGQMD